MACTTHVPRMYLACTWLAPGLHLACTSHVPRMYLALGGFAPPFCIRHSAFDLRLGVALGSHWCSLGVALGWLWSGFGVALEWLWGRNRLAINRLWGGFDVALRWLWVTFPRAFPRAEPRFTIQCSGNQGAAGEAGVGARWRSGKRSFRVRCPRAGPSARTLQDSCRASGDAITTPQRILQRRSQHPARL